MQTLLGYLEPFLRGVFPWLVTALMGALLIMYLPRYVYEGYSGRYFLRTHRAEPGEEIRFLRFGKRPLRAVCWALMMFLASRALWLIALQIYISAKGWAPLSLANLPDYVNKWDAVNYTRIAQYWYGFEDHGIAGYIKEYTIAFLPGFPLMIKALEMLVGDYVLSGLILSNAMTIGSGIILYAMVSDMYSEPAARRACFFFSFSAAAGVFSATHSESAFFFLTLLAVYLARKRRFIAAVAVGAYAAFTRQFGMFVAVPVFYEMLRSLERYPTGTDMIQRERADTGAVGAAPTLMERARHSVRFRMVWRYLLLAACAAKGTTRILNAAREPEIEDLQAFLRACGARVSGAGTSTVTVEGGAPLHGVEHTVMPDRIAAATYLCAAASAGGDITLQNVRPEELVTVTDALSQAGCAVEGQGETLRLRAEGNLRAIPPIRTAPYPGFPTDAQAILMAALLRARGATVFE